MFDWSFEYGWIYTLGCYYTNCTILILDVIDYPKRSVFEK